MTTPSFFSYVAEPFKRKASLKFSFVTSVGIEAAVTAAVFATAFFATVFALVGFGVAATAFVTLVLAAFFVAVA